MKKDSAHIEESLKQMRIDAGSFDKAGVKARLLAEIGQSVTVVSPLRVSPYTQFFRYAQIVTFSFACLFVGTTYASTYSMPGDLLYTTKVTVYEEMVALTKFSPTAQVEYAIARLEERKKDVDYIASVQTPAALSDIAHIEDLVEAEVVSVASILREATVTDIAPDSSLTYVSEVGELIHQQQQTLESLSQSEYDFATATKKSDAFMRYEVSEYVATVGSSTVAAYVSEQIDDIAPLLLATSTPDSIQLVGEDLLQDTLSDVASENLVDAIITTFEIQEILSTIE